MKIDRKMFNIIYDNALNGTIKDKDIFVNEWIISIINNDPAYREYRDVSYDDIPNFGDIVKCVSDIWDVAYLSMKDIISESKFTQKQFADNFMISVKTIESWSMGTRKPPEYVKIFICKELGMLYMIVWWDEIEYHKTDETIEKI